MGAGGGDGTQAYLQLPENLGLATGLKVPQSLGPEAVLLVQGAVATRRADESMTTQEPQHKSGTAVLRPLLLTKDFVLFCFFVFVLGSSA